ncbi:MAG: hypothetical protein ACLTBV_29015 [Enterocloster bolteae]
MCLWPVTRRSSAACSPSGERNTIQAEEGKLRKRMHSDGFTARYDASHILYRDSCMEAVISQAMKFSYSDSNILIHGET